MLCVSTAICGGSAVAAVEPTIEADNRDIAYAISATFLFDLLTVLIFPWAGRLLGLSDTSFGLWVGTSVNDTSSVVAAGYAFSDVAGQLAVIVKLTRTLFIVPIVLVFSAINAKISRQTGALKTSSKKTSSAKDLPVFCFVLPFGSGNQKYRHFARDNSFLCFKSVKTLYGNCFGRHWPENKLSGYVCRRVEAHGTWRFD